MATILALEDDRVAQELLRIILEKENHTVFFADSSAAAWELLKNILLPDLIIIDNQLRGDKGIDFLKSIRSIPIYENTPVVICITTPSRSSVLQFAGAKVQAILAKPYMPNKIIEELNKGLGVAPYSQLIEDKDTFCSRMGITAENYQNMMEITSLQLSESIQEVLSALEHKHWQELKSSITRLLSLSTSIGFNILTEYCQKIISALQSPESASIFLQKVPTSLDIISKIFENTINPKENNLTEPIQEENMATAGEAPVENEALAETPEAI